MGIYNQSKGIPKQNFIVVKHSLPKYEGEVYGVKFRGGFGVVLENSKTHRNLKNIRPKAATLEYPLLQLEKLPFVINEKQIEYIWGKAVYNQFRKKKHTKPQIEAMQKAKEEAPKCIHIKGDGEKCKIPSMNDSDYCRKHVIFDPRIKELVEELPPMPRKQKKAKIRSLIKEHIKK